jgi:hypothetical protein
MEIIFENDSTKQWLARKGPAKVFGKDVDARERLSDQEAISWFYRVWSSSIQRAIQDASLCDLEFVRSKVPYYAKNFIEPDACHKEFTYANCFFICQLPDPQRCNQLWFIPSSSADPRTLYVKFESVPIREAFDEVAQKLGWEKAEELGEKVLLDFMETVSRSLYRTEKQVERWKLQEGLDNCEEK